VPRILAVLDFAQQTLEPFGRPRLQVRVIHLAQPLGDGEQSLGTQADDVVFFFFFLFAGFFSFAAV